MEEEFDSSERVSMIFLTLLGASLATLSCQTPKINDPDEFISQLHDKEMAQWKPAKNYLIPSGNLVNNAGLLSKSWRGGGRLDSTQLTFKAISPDGYQVDFSTAGCLSHWRAKRMATFSGGIVKLNRAVEPYCGRPFDRLFLIKRGGKLLLVPGGAVEEAMSIVRARKGSEVESFIELLSLKADPPSGSSNARP